MNQAQMREALEAAWDHLRSVWEVANRKGVDTNWETFEKRTVDTLTEVVTAAGCVPKMPNMAITAKTFRMPPEGE